MRGWMLNQTKEFSGALCRTKPNEYQMLYRINDFINISYVSHESDAYREKNDFAAQSWILQFISQAYGTFTKNICELWI